MTRVTASGIWWPERRISFCVWSIGSSPASTPMKKTDGRNAPSDQKSQLALKSFRIPGTSTPMRFTASWNIWMWLHSSVISWRQ